MQPNNIEYRKIRPEETEAYRAIRLESLKEYPNSFGSVYAQQVDKPKLGLQPQIEERNPERFIVGAFDQNKLIGLCGFVRLADMRCRHRGEIIQMYVKNEYQGKNIGFQLLQATIEKAFLLAGLEQIELGVMTHVPSACRLYEKSGFVEMGVQKNYLRQGDFVSDHRLMILNKRTVSE